MSYKVQIINTAVQQIKQLNSQVQQQAIAKLEELAFNPLPEGVKNLESGENLYLVFLDKYRIVYQIHQEASLITVTKVAHPKDY
ncbi:type II toxin-antitoxin system RelE/ParE family toxin [Desmonostoc muscorum LEGE 12446]|uniref:Type II toxin-antitoxin system RelE/ParE family toxin n=1 Tax=Desmonostoc muscorum LEGE 12446 TaxID=1828758 RepID=A0A8J7CX12_DESMC|nr:type II toxin-antitoxin system RelE/ParE family toxin [Desmonostoc muscorum]MCF2145051.1 type II toxin-antitoxin system RelE/ParE family toxin [Desmonostoc muscorum LEGE 12446]